MSILVVIQWKRDGTNEVSVSTKGGLILSTALTSRKSIRK